MQRKGALLFYLNRKKNRVIQNSSFPLVLFCFFVYTDYLTEFAEKTANFFFQAKTKQIEF